MAATVLLWDFGDTLVDERWMRTPPVGCPTWEAAWLEVMAHSADRWNLGAVTSTQIFDALSVRTGMAREQVEAHARRCCEQLVFNETAWRVAKERWLPQALVTVNPDLFTDHVVPVHGLTAVFDVIVVSSAMAVAVSAGAGVAAHDGETGAEKPDMKALGCSVLIRLSGEIGVRLLLAFVEHHGQRSRLQKVVRHRLVQRADLLAGSRRAAGVQGPDVRIRRPGL